MNNPDAPTEQEFLDFYAEPDPKSAFSWTDKANGLVYTHDLSINQVQVTPEQPPYSGRVNDANKRLWQYLPPNLLEPSPNWKAHWFTAARKLDIDTMRFIIEQGFDVNTTDEDGFTALYHAVLPYGGSIEVVRLLVESGADLTIPTNAPEFLIKEAWKFVAGVNEASEAISIAYYLRNAQ
jgi:hypothetical protein